MEIKELKTIKPYVSEVDSIEIYPERIFVDRLRGSTRTETLWGEEVNMPVLVHFVAIPGVKSALRKFFSDNSLSEVLKSLIPQSQITPTDVLFTPSELAKAVSKRVSEVDAVTAIIELLCPVLLKMGCMSSNNRYSVIFDYPNKQTTVDDLRAEVDASLIGQSLSRVEKIIETNSKIKSSRVSSRILADIISQAFKEVGYVLIQTQELGAVMDDIVRGVRVHLDPTGIVGGTTGKSHSTWFTGDIVSYFARNLTFIKAALALSNQYDLTPTCEMFLLDKWGPVLRTAVTTGNRFQELMASDIRKSFHLTVIKDLKGKAKSVVVSRAEDLTPMAQSVFVTDDQAIEGASFVAGVKDRASEVLQLAYPKIEGGPSRLVHDLCSDLLRDLVESNLESPALIFRPGAVADFELEDLACFFSERVRVEAIDSGFIGVVDVDGAAVDNVTQQGEVVVLKSPDGDASNEDTQRDLVNSDDIDVNDYVGTWRPNFIYQISSHEEFNVDIKSGVHMGRVVSTRDPAELFMCVKPEDRSEHGVNYFTVSDQLLGPQSFNASFLSSKSLKERLLGVGKRQSFMITVGSLQLRAALRPADFASLRTSEAISLVSPFYNKVQLHSIIRDFVDLNKTLRSKWGIALDKERSDLVSMMQRTVAIRLLKLAQSLPIPYRDEFHDVFVTRSIISLKVDTKQVEIYRTQAMQGPVKAAIDCYALAMFCFMHGIWDEEFVNMISGVTLPEMSRAYLEVGSDRQARKV